MHDREVCSHAWGVEDKCKQKETIDTKTKHKAVVYLKIYDRLFT